MLYKCGSCNETFDYDDMSRSYDEETGVADYRCPYCDSIDVFECVECAECGKIEAIDDLKLYNDMCEDCFKRSITAKQAYEFYLSQTKVTKANALEWIFDLDDVSEIAFDALNAAVCRDYFNHSVDYEQNGNFKFARYAGRLLNWAFDDLDYFAEWRSENE